MLLPRSYISYSAASLWYQNESAFRTKYYTPGVGGGLSSVQMDYGKEIAEMLENDPENPLVAKIPKYQIRDKEFTVDISGVPVKVIPDTLDLTPVPRLREYKTGAWEFNEKTKKFDIPAWTQKKVDDWMQVKLYSLGVKIKYGFVDDLAHLDWLPTVMEDVIDGLKINGKQYGVTIQVPRLTGEIFSFPCVVTEMERFRARQWIVAAAHEISNDYKNFLKNH
jgi:hypothetical protein